MSWFKRNPKTVAQIEAPISDSQDRAMVEIVASKEAKKEVIEKAKAANAHLKELLEANHFTVTIYIAAGGKAPAQKTNAKGGKK